MNSNENIFGRDTSLKFKIFRPGGNDTCLIEGLEPNPNKRGLINSIMLDTYKNVEQVGFINSSPTNPELVMAGGEFCGNATRSAAWQILNGQPGQIEIKVSGAEQKLKAGVTEAGEAFAQMPVYEDPQYITEDPNNPGNYTVKMQGITHYLDFNSEQLAGLTEEEIKVKGMEQIRQAKLDTEPAAGTIYVKQTKGKYEISPVVYVRDTKCLYYETACGSGTTALGLSLALKAGKSINNVQIMQPSGLPIAVSVDFDGNKFGYTQIQGPINKLAKGELEIKANKNIYTVEDIEYGAQLDQALDDGLISLYQEAFGEFPYDEKFKPEDVKEYFINYLLSGNISIARDAQQVVAFEASVPLWSSESPDLLKRRYGANSDIWYFAELGVSKNSRRKGLGKRLAERRIQALTNSTMILRTSINNTRAIPLYEQLGFTRLKDLGEFVINLRTDGTTRTDERIYMLKKGKNEKKL